MNWRTQMIEADDTYRYNLSVSQQISITA